MNKNRKILLRVMLVMVLASPRLLFAAKTDQIVAIVNGDVITEDELNVFAKLSNFDNEKIAGSAGSQELRRSLLDRMIEDRLILQEAKRLQMKADESVIDERVRGIRLKAGSLRAFNEALRSEGISLTELKQKLRDQYLIYTLVQRAVKAKVTVSPKEVTDYFDQHQDEFVTPESVVVDSIFVKEAQTLKTVEDDLGQGKDFNEVARAYSERSNLGEVSRGQLKKELQDVIFSLQAGERSGPIPAGDGYYIFLAREKLAPSKKTIEEVKDTIKAHIEDEKLEKQLKEWLESLKEKAYISIRE